MVDCPREVIGIVLKYMGFSYNTDRLDSNVYGGTSAFQKNLALLAKQVQMKGFLARLSFLKLFDQPVLFESMTGGL